MFNRIFTGALALGLAGALQAAPLLDQPHVLADAQVSSTGPGHAGYITYDRIMLGQASAVRQVSWVGAFTNLADLADVTWTFLVSDDWGGLPGSPTSHANVAGARVGRSLLQQAELDGQMLDLYAFTATLDLPLQVAGGVTQWFAVLAGNSLFDPGFLWLSGSGDDGVALQEQVNGAASGPYADRALRLDANQVPEPATLALLGLAGAAALALHRRRPRGLGAR